jgi:hypothetical protein
MAAHVYYSTICLLQGTPHLIDTLLNILPASIVKFDRSSITDLFILYYNCSLAMRSVSDSSQDFWCMLLSTLYSGKGCYCFGDPTLFCLCD